MFTPITVPERGNPLFGQQVETAIAGLAQFINDYNSLISILNGAITGNSSTLLAISTGTKNPTVEAGLNLVPGYPIRLAYKTDPTKYMDGVCVSYDDETGALGADISSVSGSGSYANWQIMVLPAAGDYASKGANKFTGQQVLANEATIASASTLDLTALNSNHVKITGTVALTGVTMPQSAVIIGRPTGALPLTNSSSFIVQGGADYTCTAGDILTFTKDGDGNVHISINPISGKPIGLKKSDSTKAIAGTDDADYMTALSTRQAYPIRTLMTAWSSAYTPASGENLTASHGQSSVPYAVKLILECVSADAGYSVGDRVTPTGNWNGSITNALAFYADATVVGVKCISTSVIYVQNKTTGAATTPAAGKWKYAFEFKV